MRPAGEKIKTGVSAKKNDQKDGKQARDLQSAGVAVPAVASREVLAGACSRKFTASDRAGPATAEHGDARFMSSQATLGTSAGSAGAMWRNVHSLPQPQYPRCQKERQGAPARQEESSQSAA